MSCSQYKNRQVEYIDKTNKYDRITLTPTRLTVKFSNLTSQHDRDKMSAIADSISRHNDVELSQRGLLKLDYDCVLMRDKQKLYKYGLNGKLLSSKERKWNIQQI